MKKIISIVFAIIPLLILSQDIIILKNSTDTIYCKIVEDKIAIIEYRLINSSDSTIYSIKTTETEGYIKGEYELSEIEHNQYIETIQSFDSINYLNNKYVSGIYRTFSELLNNSASIKGEVKRNYKNSKSSNRKYNIYCVDSSGSRHEFIENYWGYSDGEERYIYQKYTFYQLFHQIYSVGDHFVYDYVKRSSSGGYWTSGSPSHPPTYMPNNSFSYTWQKKFIYGKTGEIYTLNKRTLKKLNIPEQDKLWIEYLKFKNMDYDKKKHYKEHYFNNP